MTDPQTTIAMTGTDADTDAAAALFKALAHPLRLRLLHVLTQGPHTVGALQAAVAADQAAVSAQLLRLRNEGLVACHRAAEDARIMHYTLADPRIGPLLRTALNR